MNNQKRVYTDKPVFRLSKPGSKAKLTLRQKGDPMVRPMDEQEPEVKGEETMLDEEIASDHLPTELPDKKIQEDNDWTAEIDRKYPTIESLAEASQDPELLGPDRDGMRRALVERMVDQGMSPQKANGLLKKMSENDNQVSQIHGAFNKGEISTEQWDEELDDMKKRYEAILKGRAE